MEEGNFMTDTTQDWGMYYTPIKHIVSNQELLAFDKNWKTIPNLQSQFIEGFEAIFGLHQLEERN